MKKIFSFLIVILLTANTINAQSLIEKFVEATFILSDTFKSPDGYYFANVGYKLNQGSILMISATGEYEKFRPMLIVRGPVENGKEATPVLKFYDNTYGNETYALYLLPKTGDYSIIIANGRLGEKGTVKTSMGLANMDWLDNTKIFPTVGKDPFALALANLLRHAIFNFNFIKGEKRTGYMGRIYNNTFTLPGADMGSPYTSIGDYQHGATFLMGEIYYKSLSKKPGDDEALYDQKDSSIALKKYDSLKSVLLSALSTDFVIEREEKFKLPFEKEPYKNGRRIIITHKGNEAIIDPNNYLPELLASKKMKVELSLELGNIISRIYLKVYSKQQ